MLPQHMEYKIDDTVTVPTEKIARVGSGTTISNEDIPIVYRYKN